MEKPVDISSKASIGLVKAVPGGEVQMGSRFHPREERRIVRLLEFEIGHAPVTVNQYAAFLENQAAGQQRWWSREGLTWLMGISDGWGRENRQVPDAWEAQVKRPYRPVVGVSWYEAEAYCKWLAYQKKRPVRLPSEEEWEYAARGEDGRPFPWGEYFDASLANTLESGRLDTVDAGSLPGDVSPFGVLDMAGNVQQWTASRYVPLSGEVIPTQVMFVARGGSFNDSVFGSRTAYRRAYPPGYFYPFLGFRVAVGIVK
jgi:formylglycine-generating enzyme required for sulfatase activity